MRHTINNRPRTFVYGIIKQTGDPYERQDGLYAVGQIIILETTGGNLPTEVGSGCKPPKSGYYYDTVERLVDAIERSEELWNQWYDNVLPHTDRKTGTPRHDSKKAQRKRERSQRGRKKKGRT